MLSWCLSHLHTEIYLIGKKFDTYPFTGDSSVLVYVIYYDFVAESYPIQGGAKFTPIENSSLVTGHQLVLQLNNKQ